MDKKKLVVGPGQEDNKHFGEILERLRKRAQLSRAEAANAIGLSSEYIRTIERGLRTPAAGQMVRILGAYGVPDDSAFGERIITVDGHEVEFISRIQEARGKETFEPNRYEKVGRIVSMLTTADESTINKIYRMLERR